MSKIIITGGHHNSALEVAKKLRSQGHQVLWIGHKFSMKNDKQLSAEYQEVTKNNFPFYELKTGKYYNVKNPFKFVKIFFGFIQSFSYLISNKPDLIVSFGGYLAVPVIISGYLLGIKSVTHEQTIVAGLANKAISPFVKKIFLSHPASQKNYPKHKSIVTGLPIRADLLNNKVYKKTKKKIIYITCGKQGSHIINEVVFGIIEELTKKYLVYHQTGANSATKDFEKAKRVYDSLPNELKLNYKFKPYFFSHEATKLLKNASLVISRGGAHTVYELLLLDKRSIIIPIPWVSHNEQYLNANIIKKYGKGIILQESELTKEHLMYAIENIMKMKFIKKSKYKLITDADKRIVDEINLLLNEESKR